MLIGIGQSERERASFYIFVGREATFSDFRHFCKFKFSSIENYHLNNENDGLAA